MLVFNKELIGNNTPGKAHHKCYINKKKEKSNDRLCTSNEEILALNTGEKDHGLGRDGNLCDNITRRDSATTVELEVDLLQNLGPTQNLTSIIEYVHPSSPEELLETAENNDSDEDIGSVFKKRLSNGNLLLYKTCDFEISNCGTIRKQHIRENSL